MKDKQNFEIPEIDWSKPDEVTVDNKRIFSVRCRIPFSHFQGEVAEPVKGLVRSAEAVDLSETAKDMGIKDFQERVFIDDGEGIKLDPEATGDLGSNDEVNWGELPLLNGIASSTSVDFYGTEMSLGALKEMAVQMMSTTGIPYLPRHNNGASGSLEWDEVIGRTIYAEVVPTEDVKRSYNPAEAQFILRVTTQIYDNEEKSQSLIRRLERGEQIGQSIGGWFTNLNVMQNDEGEVERVIVQGVELDHLAVTRAPANPDSIGIVSLRSKFQQQASAPKEEAPKKNILRLPKDEAVRLRESSFERHIVEWMPNEDGTITIVFAIHHDEEHNSSEEMEEEGKGKDKKKGYYSQERASIFADLPMAPIEMDWSFDADDQNEVLFQGRTEGDADWDRYKAAHAYFDPEKAEIKSGYKLPIAKMIEGELHVVWRGVAAAMAALNGARGGVDIDDRSREEAYGVLVEYYNKFEKEAPELASRSETGVDKVNDSEQDVTSEDAGTSAPEVLDFNNSTTDTVEGSVLASEENPMGTEQLQEVLRSLLKDELTPLVERIDSLEARDAEKEETTETVENTVEERTVNLEEELAAANARAEEAEKKLANASRQPVRVGRSTTPAPEKAASLGAFENVINRAQASAPTLCASAEKAATVLNEEQGVPTRRTLETTLRSLLLAAEKDGVIINPDARSAWQ